MRWDPRMLKVTTAIMLTLSSCASGTSDIDVQRHDIFHDTGDQTRQTEVARAAATRPEDIRTEPTPTAPAAIDLSPQAQKVSQIAVENGDRDFLMIDKLRGQLIFFKNGLAVFSDAALTGASTADRLSPGLLAMSFAHPLTNGEKVTPAGRFTVTRQYDKSYGITFDINEVQGKDWSLAIHPVYLGLPYEQRLVRLRSATSRDNHITFGCINVGNNAIQYLARNMPRRGRTPLYILPLDESLTSTFFSGKKSPR